MGTVVVYGASTSGITTAVQAARMGCNVWLLEASNVIGYMWATGLGRVDRGVPRWGLVSELEVQAGINAGTAPTVFPSMPNVQSIIDMWLGELSSLITLVKNVPLEMVNREKVSGGRKISSIVCGGVTYTGTQFHDGTDEGDLMAWHCLLRIGRESATMSGDPYSGIRNISVTTTRTFYPATGERYANIDPAPVQKLGDADWRVMAYNKRTIVTQHASRTNWADIDLTPVGGDPPAEDYRAELEIADNRNMTTMPGSPGGSSPGVGLLPIVGGVETYDMNNGGYAGVGSNRVGWFNDWHLLSHAERVQRVKEYDRWFLGLFKTICTDAEWLARCPALVADTKTWGLATGTFPDSDVVDSSPYIYVRENQRMVGQEELVIADVTTPDNNDVAEPVCAFGYLRDSHVHERYSSGAGVVTFEGAGAVEPPSTLSLMPWGCLKARKNDAINLTVSRAISGLYGAWVPVRIEMTYMELGQVCGAAMALADSLGTYTGILPYSQLRPVLEDIGAVMTV